MRPPLSGRPRCCKASTPRIRAAPCTTSAPSATIRPPSISTCSGAASRRSRASSSRWTTPARPRSRPRRPTRSGATRSPRRSAPPRRRRMRRGRGNSWKRSRASRPRRPSLRPSRARRQKSSTRASPRSRTARTRTCPRARTSTAMSSTAASSRPIPGSRRAASISRSARPRASWISRRRPGSRAPASWCSRASSPGWNGHSASSCSTCTRASTAIPRWRPRSWCATRRCSARRNCRNSATTSSPQATATG
ncbi:hypothetical protein AEGHOMDF_2718 [Methylobacterium soli]|nr:hypothetical protein AEGHOMDF_2718 [Methylobacterium soli]